jgi:hypothetical protein
MVFANANAGSNEVLNADINAGSNDVLHGLSSPDAHGAGDALGLANSEVETVKLPSPNTSLEVGEEISTYAGETGIIEVSEAGSTKVGETGIVETGEAVGLNPLTWVLPADSVLLDQEVLGTHLMRMRRFLLGL